MSKQISVFFVKCWIIAGVLIAFSILFLLGSFMEIVNFLLKKILHAIQEVSILLQRNVQKILLIDFCRTYKVKYRILRMPNVVGGYDPKASPKKNAIHYLIGELKKGNDITSIMMEI